MKGTQKKMLLLKNTGSDIFDEAYFILKDTLPPRPVEQSEMIREANRIVNENLISGYFRSDRKKKGIEGARHFLCGLICGGVLTLVFCMLTMG